MNILFYEEEPEQDDVKKLESLEKEIIKISVEELKEKYPEIIENSILQNNCKSSSKNNINRTERLNKVLNKTSGNPYHDEKGRFTFNPGQSRGVGKPTRGFSSPTVIYTGDDIALEKDGVLLEGTLQYKDGKFYLLTDKKESRLIEISKDDVRRSIVTKSAKQKKKELLESQGIRHKTPKERRTPEQKRLISELDKMGLFKNKDLGAWCTKYADKETLDDIYTTLKEAESLGLDVNSIQLEKIRSGRTWGRAYYRADGNFKLALSGKIYDRNPIQEKEIKECREGFHTDNSIKAVVRHETGHIISYQNAQRSYNTKDNPENIWQQEDKVDSYCGKVVSEAMGYSYFTYRETLKDLKKYSNSEISEYGRTNFKEAIAESWSNPNYSSFTKKVSDILKKDLKKPRENSIMNERTEEIPICSGYGPEFEDFEYETSTGKVKTNSRIMRLCSLEKVINSQTENLDYRYDVKAYKEYLKEWLKHKDEKEYLDGGVLSFAEFWEHDIDYEFEDYNKILKLIDEHNKKKELVTNGGPGSGNHNPGQGRGVGKPANKTGKTSKSSSPSLKMSENSKKFYEKLNPKIQESFEKCVSRLKKTGVSLDNVELEFVNSNTSGGDNGWVNVVDGDNIDSKMIVNLIKPVLKKFTKKEQDVYKHAFVADNSSEAIIDHELGHVLMYKKAAEIGIKPKSAHLFAEMIVNNEAKKLNIDLNDGSTENFSEYAHRNYTEFIAEAYSRPDYSKLTQNVSDSLCNNKYSKDDFKNFIIELTGIQTNEKIEKDKTSKNSLKTTDYLRNNLLAKSYFRSQRLFAILNKVNRGNPYHDEKGRFASNDGLIKNISRKWEKYSISLNSGKLFNDVMEKNGWYRNKDGTWETSKKINSIKLGKIDKKSEEIVYNNGKKYISHDSTENYKSKWSDEDAPAFYTTDSREDAENYNDGDWSKTITLVVNKKNFISDKELDKIRDKIELESGFKFSKKSFPDTVLADELGKSGIIRKTDIGTEYISLNLDNFKEFRNK